MKNPLTPAGIEPATFRFVAQHLNHCATTSVSKCFGICALNRLNAPEPLHYGDISLTLVNSEFQHANCVRTKCICIVFLKKFGVPFFRNVTTNIISLFTVKAVQSSISICSFVQATSSNMKLLRITKSIFCVFV
jgi:hypothetical protein